MNHEMHSAIVITSFILTGIVYFMLFVSVINSIFPIPKKNNKKERLLRMNHEIHLTKEDLQKIQNGETVSLYVHKTIHFNERVDIKLNDKEKLIINCLC